MSKIVVTKSAEETEKMGEDFAKNLHAGDAVCLYGDLGTGKTTFVKGVARGLGIKSRVISPTFILVRKHEVKFKIQKAKGKNENKKLKVLYHIDLYRLHDEKDIKGVGLEEILEDKEAVVLIEWPEKAKKVLSKNKIDITFEYKNDKMRKITIGSKNTN